MNIGKYREFCEEKFGLRRSLGKIRDSRKRPQIPLATVLRSVMDMVAMGQRSLLEVDQCGRDDSFKAWHGSRRRMVASDTTIERTLEGIDLSEVREMLYGTVRCAEAGGLLRAVLPSGRAVRVGIVDGSDFGGFEGCVFALGRVPVDVEMHTRGKELNAACRLLSRVGHAFGKDFVDVVVGDGLYMSRHHIRQCKEELHCDALIKTTEERLTVIEDAKGLFAKPFGPREGVERIEGVDVERKVKYMVTAAGGFEWDGLPYRLKVARVEEEKLKPRGGKGKFEVFWTVTTDETLSGEEMRELAHLRWVIENDVFKRLNELVGSKRGFLRNARVKEAMLLLWFAALVMLRSYLADPGLAMVRKAYAAVKATWKFVTRLFLRSIWRLCPAGVF